MTKCFVYISGENDELAKAETAALSRLFSKDFDIQWNGRLGIIEGRTDFSGSILERAALTQKAGKVLYISDSVEGLTSMVSDDFWRDMISVDETFSIKTLCVNTEIALTHRLQLERSLGAHIKAITNASVDLRNALVQILVILTDTDILVCRSTESELRSILGRRMPGKKPFFHPSMMNSSLARVMCNLVELRKRDILLDPFCGGGGILCEGAYLGAFVVGYDINWKLVNGARINLEEISQKYCVLQADIQQSPISSADCIVTDPPYGRSSSTRGIQSTRLVDQLLQDLDSLVHSEGEHVCICGSTEMRLPSLVQDAGFRLGQDIKIRVHSGLVREIVTIVL